jgi:hypothetical protein
LRLVFSIQLSVLSKEKERLGAALLEMTGEMAEAERPVVGRRAQEAAKSRSLAALGMTRWFDVCE